MRPDADADPASRRSAIDINQSKDIKPTSPTPLPVGERPQFRASEIAGEGSCFKYSAPHPVCSLRSQTTLSPAGRGSESLAGSTSLRCKENRQYTAQLQPVGET